MTPAFGFGAQVAQVEVDQETGLVEVKQMWTAHDCGTVINPRAVEGQLAGSIQMGLGYALSEQFVMDGGKTLNTNFLDYKMPNALDMPPSEVVHIETYEPEGPLGAKECGEGLASPRPRPLPMRSITPPATAARTCPSPRRRFCKACKKVSGRRGRRNRCDSRYLSK